MKRNQLFLLSALLILASAFSACAPSLGGTIAVPSIPLAENMDQSRARLFTSVDVVDFKDGRGAAPSEDSGFTEPRGDIDVKLQEAIGDALTKRGISVFGGAPVKITGEVRTWRTQVAAEGAVGTISSEAALFIQVLDRNGSVRYSGTYRGSRSSQFPVVAESDVQESLGLAMSQAIAQLMEDQQFLQSLWES